MNEHTFLHRRVLTVVLAIVATCAVACNGGAGAFCQEARNCEGGNDADENACNIGADEDADRADLRNCTAEHDDYKDCVFENARCNNKRYDIDPDTCKDVQERYNNCIHH